MQCARQTDLFLVAFPRKDYFVADEDATWLRAHAPPLPERPEGVDGDVAEESGTTETAGQDQDQ